MKMNTDNLNELGQNLFPSLDKGMVAIGYFISGFLIFYINWKSTAYCCTCQPSLFVADTYGQPSLFGIFALTVGAIMAVKTLWWKNEN